MPRILRRNARNRLVIPLFGQKAVKVSDRDAILSLNRIISGQTKKADGLLSLLDSNHPLIAFNLSLQNDRGDRNICPLLSPI